jgi:hypothetical protein
MVSRGDGGDATWRDALLPCGDGRLATTCRCRGSVPTTTAAPSRTAGLLLRCSFERAPRLIDGFG